MRQFNTVEEAYDFCSVEGNFIPKTNVDEGVIESCLKIAKEDLLCAKEAIKNKRWNSAYKMYYDVLHQLVEAYLRQENIKVKNHFCLFAYLCVKFPNLDLNWDFFETVRYRRNGVQYYGSMVTEKDWKEVALEFDLTINQFIKLIEDKIQ